MPTLKSQSQTYPLSTEFGLSFWYNQALLYVGLGRDTHLYILEPVTTTPPENGPPPPLFITKVPLPPFSPAGLACLMCLSSHRLWAIKGPSNCLSPLMVTARCGARFTRCDCPHLSASCAWYQTLSLNIVCQVFWHKMGLRAPNLTLLRYHSPHLLPDPYRLPLDGTQRLFYVSAVAPPRGHQRARRFP